MLSQCLLLPFSWWINYKCITMLLQLWFQGLRSVTTVTLVVEFPRVCVPGCSGHRTPSILGSLCRISEPFQAASYRDSPPAAHRGGDVCCGVQRFMISQNHRNAELEGRGPIRTLLKPEVTVTHLQSSNLWNTILYFWGCDWGIHIVQSQE